MPKLVTKNPKYLLLHRSGVIAATNSIEPLLEGITAIINLSTLELFDGIQWKKIPIGDESLIKAEEDENELEEVEEETGNLPIIQTGAKRIFDPTNVWTYTKAKF